MVSTPSSAIAALSYRSRHCCQRDSMAHRFFGCGFGVLLRFVFVLDVSSLTIEVTDGNEQDRGDKDAGRPKPEIVVSFEQYPPTDGILAIESGFATAVTAGEDFLADLSDRLRWTRCTRPAPSGSSPPIIPIRLRSSQLNVGSASPSSEGSAARSSTPVKVSSQSVSSSWSPPREIS